MSVLAERPAAASRSRSSRIIRAAHRRSKRQPIFLLWLTETMNPRSENKDHLEIMKSKKQPIQRLTSYFYAGLTTLVLFGLCAAINGQDPNTNSPPREAAPNSQQGTAVATNKPQVGSTNSASADAAAKQAKLAPKQLTGAELYSMHCARCHPERYPNERTAAQWKTIGMHMRVRANLPAEHFRKLLKYLQDNSGY
jgi:hypothetical protein